MMWAIGFITLWAVLSIPFGVLIGKMISLGHRE
jgi:hypothetical protein